MATAVYSKHSDFYVTIVYNDISHSEINGKQFKPTNIIANRDRQTYRIFFA